MLSWLLHQHRAIQCLFLLILIQGFYSLGQLGKEELPEPTNEMDGVSIVAYLPGTTPTEIDRQIARPIHLAIKDMPGVREVQSEAFEGYVSTRVRFKNSEADPGALSQEISQKVNQITTLPQETKGPYVSRYRSRIWEDMTLVFRGGDALARHAQWRWVANRLQSEPGVSELVVTGEGERRVEVQVDGLLAGSLGSRIDSVADQLEKALDQRSAGQIQDTKNLHSVQVETRPESVKELAGVPIFVGQEYRPLEMIAQVEDSLEPPSVLVDHDDQGAWYVQVYRQPGSNVEHLSRSIRALSEQINAQLKQDELPFELRVISDRSEQVKQSFADLKFAIALGMLLVFLVLWLFVGLRNALYAALGIPFAFLASFIVMGWLGLNLNLLTLFGLVLVCGMVVDDTIVVLEAIVRQRELGCDRYEAIKKGSTGNPVGRG